MVIEINNPFFVLTIAVFILIWVFYGLYLRGMILGRYNELKEDKNVFNKQYSINFLKVEFIFGILWFLGIVKIPNNDKKLKSLIFRQRVWFLMGIIALVLIYF